MDYKELYEEEHLKTADLAGRVAELEAEVSDLTFKLDRIKTNPLWKASKPFRVTMHFVIRNARRIKNQGSVRGVINKIRYKKNEKEAMKRYGTLSFPDEERRKKEESETFPYMPKISILVPLFNTPEQFLREMIDSVVAQTYQNWELCLADGSDDAHKYVSSVVKEYMDKDDRIVYKALLKNEGISGNTNRCLELATGEYIGLFDHDDIIHPSVLYEYVKVINSENADYIYCDETTFRSGDINRMLTMHFKPDYAIDNLRANNYICHFSVFKRTLLDGTELFRPQFDGSQDHDMILRLTDRAEHIVHVPKLMYYWRCHEMSTASNIEAKPYAIEAAKGAVSDHLKRHGYKHFKITSTRAFETIFKIRYEIEGNPLISIIIPNKDHYEDLSRCIRSIEEKSTYDNYEIIVVENNSTDEKIFSYYEELKDDDKITVVAYSGANPANAQDIGVEKVIHNDTSVINSENEGNLAKNGKNEGFNYSKINNFGAKYANGDYFILLNNDTEVLTVNWMEEMLMYAQRSDVACVGAKLYYPDKTIQHAGVVLGMGIHHTAGHSHYKQHRENLGYMGRLCYAQDVSAVTGACLMVKKELFYKVGGLSEDFAVSLNDVDFCLKLRSEGYLNVFTPFAELWHYESASRGDDLSGKNAERYDEESAHFRDKWKEVLDKGDPYFNPNFTLLRSDFSLKTTP